jgi:hypothetical protein
MRGARGIQIVKALLGLFVAGMAVTTLFFMALAVRTAYGAPDKATVTRAYHVMAVRGQVRRFEDAAVTIRRLKRENRQLRHHWAPVSRDAIALAAVVYRQSEGDLLRVAMCETGGSLSPYAKNRSSSASGLYQFLHPSTWSSTPFARFSVWNPYANALAAGWMWSVGRRGEWVCQ